MGAVTVVAPAPELTITIEAGTRDDELHLHAGGQGFWIARLVAALGCDVTLVGSFGGETGRVVRMLIEHEGISVIASDDPADNGGYVHDRRGGERRAVASQPPAALGRHGADELYSTALATALASEVCVLGGTHPQVEVIPPDMYRRLATDLTNAGRMVIADLSGREREAASRGGVAVLKTSEEDLVADGLLPDHPSAADVAVAIDRLRGGAAAMVVTRGAEPAVCWLDGGIVQIEGPRFETADPRGAGDAFTAGVAATLAVGSDLADGLRVAAAAAALNVTRRGLGSGTRAAIERVVPLVSVVPIR